MENVNEPEEPEALEEVDGYVIDREIGRGGFGTVYAATHPIIKKRVAIKVLDRAASSRRDLVSRFQTEARLVNEIDSRHVVDIFTFGTLPDGRFHYVMELVDGPSLREILKERGPLRLDELLPLLRPIAEALDAAHQRGVVHRDLKPANILVAETARGPEAKLADFGIAKLTGEARDAADQVDHATETGVPLGTPGYMSPEQCCGETVDARTDVYALGVILFEALAGQPPFTAPTALKLMMLHANQPAPRLSEIDPALHPLDDVMAAILAKTPSQRPDSASEALEALARAGDDLGATPRLSPSEPPAAADPIAEDTLPAASPTDLGSAHTAPALSEQDAPSRPRRAPLLLGLAAGGIALALGGWLIGSTRGPAGADEVAAPSLTQESRTSAATSASVAREAPATPDEDLPAADSVPEATASASTEETAASVSASAPPPPRPRRPPASRPFPTDPPSADELTF